MAIISGTPLDDTLNGTAGDDTIYGLAGNDRLNGGTGNDVLNGHEGDDYLHGGSGADSMNGGVGNDIYVVDHVGDSAGEFAHTLGVDTVYSYISHTLDFTIERLELVGEATINGTGNENANTIFGNGANNVLSGLDGEDYLSGGNGNDALHGGIGDDSLEGEAGNDVLNGGVGFDTMDGGAGHDTYVVDSPLDVVIDRGSTSDIDTVQSNISHRLNGTIERLILTGTAAINGSGNEQNLSLIHI